MCDRTHKEDYDSHRKHTLSTARWLDLIDELATLGVRQILVIGGGDPLMHPDIRLILDRISQRSICLHLWTNGTLITERTVQWIANAAQILTVSMDSAKDDVNDASRGVPGTTRRIKRALSLLREQPRRPYIRIHAVISAISYPFLNDFLSFIEEYGIQEFGGGLVNPWEFVPEAMLFKVSEVAERDEHIRAFAREVALRGVSLAGCFNPIMRSGLMQLATRVAPPFGGAGTPALNTCFGLWSTATVRPNGDVSVCCFTYQPKLGTVQTASFSEVWESAKAEAMRETVQAGTYLDGPCRGCDFGSKEINTVASSTDDEILSELGRIIVAAR
jgi:radical SAM protein with 4Fe4S-binding SPASM domain